MVRDALATYLLPVLAFVPWLFIPYECLPVVRDASRPTLAHIGLVPYDTYVVREASRPTLAHIGLVPYDTHDTGPLPMLDFGAVLMVVRDARVTNLYSYWPCAI